MAKSRLPSRLINFRRPNRQLARAETRPTYFFPMQHLIGYTVSRIYGSEQWFKSHSFKIFLYLPSILTKTSSKT